MNNARRLMDKMLASQLYAEMIERGRGGGVFMALRKGIEILSEFLPKPTYLGKFSPAPEVWEVRS